MPQNTFVNIGPGNDLVPPNTYYQIGVLHLREISQEILKINLLYFIYRQVSNIRRTLVGNKIVDNSDVVGASPVGAAPTTSSLST